MKAITRRRKRLRRTIAGILFLVLSLVFISDSRSALPIDREAILQHLNAAISWYRDSTSKIQSVGMPSDAIYQDTAQNLAQQAVRLAFQSAQAGALLMSAPRNRLLQLRHRRRPQAPVNSKTSRRRWRPSKLASATTRPK